MVTACAGFLMMPHPRHGQRIWMGFSLFALLTGISATPIPAVPSDSPSDRPAGSAVDPDHILRACLLPTPAGYVVSPQQHKRQEPPFPVTPTLRALLCFPHFPELAGDTMGWAL